MSVFTTRSVTVTLEKIRDQIKAATPAPADFNVLIAPAGGRAILDLGTINGFTATIRRQTGTAPGAPANIAASSSASQWDIDQRPWTRRHHRDLVAPAQRA